MSGIVKVDDYGLDLVKLIKEIGVVIDYTRIREYESKRKDITTLDIISAPIYMRDFNNACDHVSNLLAKLELAISIAKSERDAEESKAKLERASVYFKEHGTLDTMKDSDALRKTYLKIDEIYQRACQKYDALNALHAFLVNKHDAFKRDYYAVKQIHASFSGNPSAKTGYEGMTSRGTLGDSTDD